MIVRSSLLYDLSHIYPETDGLPMAENTTQYRWIVTIKGGLDIQYRDDANVFIAGDLFWYPLQGQTGIRVAPDVMVALGRPRGDRRSYLQWMEDNVPPQVVFEILSPGNREQEIDDKFAFYQRHGVEEYYLYDPDERLLQGWQRSGAILVEISQMDGWISPRLHIRFDMAGPELRVFGRNGRQFVDVPELDAQREQEQREKELAQKQTEQERREKELAQKQTEQERREKELAEQQAEQERHEKELAQQQAEQERREKEQAQQKETETAVRAERLAAQLRALGIEPEQ